MSGVGCAVTDEVLTSEALVVRPSKARVLWLRRTRSNQVLDTPVADDATREIINNDCRGGLTGLLSTHFTGKWISSPEATYRASDKICQLEVARRCGFRVPGTLVSQSRHHALEFVASCNGNLAATTIVGARVRFCKRSSCPISNLEAIDDESFAAPTIFRSSSPDLSIFV